MPKFRNNIFLVFITLLLCEAGNANGKHWRRDRRSGDDQNNENIEKSDWPKNSGDNQNTTRPEWQKGPDFPSEGPMTQRNQTHDQPGPAPSPQPGKFPSPPSSPCGKDCKREYLRINDFHWTHIPPNWKHEFVYDIRPSGEDALIVHFSSDPRLACVYIEVKNEENGEISDIKRIPTPADKNSWDLIISTEILSDFKHGKLYITAHTAAQPSRVGIRLGYGSFSVEQTPSIIIALPSIAAAAVLCCLLSICYCYIKRRSQIIDARGMHPSNTLHVQLSEEIREKLSGKNLDDNFPEGSFENFKSPFLQPTCTICLEEFKEGLICRQLHCDHIFHSHCVKNWLTSQVEKGKATCPNCNEDVLKYKDRDSVDQRC